MNILEFGKKKVQVNIKIIMDTCDPNLKEILKLKANKLYNAHKFKSRHS